MKNYSLPIVLFLAVAAFGCSKDQERGSDGASSTALPRAPSTWMAGANNSAEDSSIAPPSDDFAASVLSSFQAHSAALESITNRQTETTTDNAPLAASPDWTPWHLDGLIGGFGFDVGGIFGTLAIDGAPSVKVTWQKVANNRQAKAKSPKATSVRFHSSMSNQEVAALVEPAVALAVSSKRVRDGRRLRGNLEAEAARFLSFIRVLSTVRPASAWHVDGYQLSLSVSASGDVSPEISVGGTFLVIFDWQATGESFSPVASSRMTPQEAELQPKIADFTRNIESLLPLARASASEIRSIGFELQVFQVGLGITAGGDIGVASAQGFVGGRVIFKKDSSAEFVYASMPAPVPESISIVGTDEDLSSQKLGGSQPLLASLRDPGRSSVFQVPANRFANGLSRAIKMGTFFAKQAVSVESSNWKTTEIELGLDASIGGSVGLVTVAGSGLIRLGFERVER